MMTDRKSPVHPLIITGDKMKSLIKAAGVKVESYWPGIFAKSLEGQDISSFFNFGGVGGGSAPAAEPAKAETKKEDKKDKKPAAKPVEKPAEE